MKYFACKVLLMSILPVVFCQSVWSRLYFASAYRACSGQNTGGQSTWWQSTSGNIQWAYYKLAKYDWQNLGRQNTSWAKYWQAKYDFMYLKSYIACCCVAHEVLCPPCVTTKYIAHEYSASRILPIVFCQYVLRMPVFCPLQARYILVKYWLAKNHMQSTNVQSTTGNLPVGKRHYGQRTSWQRPIGLNTTGKWMLGKMLRGQYDWQANYDWPKILSDIFHTELAMLYL